MIIVHKEALNGINIALYISFYKYVHMNDVILWIVGWAGRSPWTLNFESNRLHLNGAGFISMIMLFSNCSVVWSHPHKYKIIEEIEQSYGKLVRN